MLRQDKERIVGELAERLKSSQNLLVADYRGLTMPEIDELRSKLLEIGARFSVVKNTLTRLAAEEAGMKQLLDLIDGPTAIAFIDAEGDPAAAAKILNDTARAHDVLVIRGGLLEGDTVSDVEIKRLATLPPADVVRAQFAGAVAAPLTTIVSGTELWRTRSTTACARTRCFGAPNRVDAPAASTTTTRCGTAISETITSRRRSWACPGVGF